MKTPAGAMISRCWWRSPGASSCQGGPAIGCLAEHRVAFLKVPHTARFALECMQVRQSAKS
jgi:hypothetical protein